MKDVSKKYFIKDKKRNTFCIMLFIITFLLSITSLLVDIYDYNMEIMKNSSYFTVSDVDKELLGREKIETISRDEHGSCYVRVPLEDYDEFMNFLNEGEFGYIEQDNSDEILNYIKLKPIVSIAVVMCLIFELLIAIVIIWRKFKKEEYMRTNLNNIGANIGTLIKLDSVYVWVFVCYWLLCSVLVTIGLSIFKFSGYLSNNKIYVYGSVGVIHLVMLVIYFILLYMSVWKIKTSK